MPPQAVSAPIRRPFPSLSVFTIYTISAWPFSELSLPDDEDAVNDAKVVYFDSATEQVLGDVGDDSSIESRLRRQRRTVGTLMGLQDFSK